MVVTPKILKKEDFLVCPDNFTKEFTEYKIKPWETDENVNMQSQISFERKNIILCSLPMFFSSLTGIISDFFHLRQHGPCVSFDIVGHKFSGGVGVLQYSSHCIQRPLHWYQTTQRFCSWHWGQLSKQSMLLILCFYF